jgi:hypothetical protein
VVGRDADDLHERSQRLRKVVEPLADSESVLETARAMGWLVGTRDEIVSLLTRFAEAGVYRAILGHYDLNEVAALELIARQVMPALE